MLDVSLSALAMLTLAGLVVNILRIKQFWYKSKSYHKTFLLNQLVKEGRNKYQCPIVLPSILLSFTDDALQGSCCSCYFQMLEL